MSRRPSELPRGSEERLYTVLQGKARATAIILRKKVRPQPDAAERQYLMTNTCTDVLGGSSTKGGPTSPEPRRLEEQRTHLEYQEECCSPVPRTTPFPGVSATPISKPKGTRGFRTQHLQRLVTAEPLESNLQTSRIL